MTVNQESNEKEISGERTIELTRMVRINQSTSFWHQEQTADETYKLINDEVKRSIIKLYSERITRDHYCNAPRIDEISRCQPSTLGITPIAQRVLILPGAHFVIAHTRVPRDKLNLSTTNTIKALSDPDIRKMLVEEKINFDLLLEDPEGDLTTWISNLKDREKKNPSMAP